MLRSIFITLYFLFTLFGWVLSLIHVISLGGHAGWFANAVVFSGLMLWWLYLRFGRLANAAFGGIVLTAAAGAGMLISVGYHNIVNDGSPFSFQLPLVGFFMWLLYHMWYCKVPKQKTLPQGTGADASSYTLKLGVRGAWCPYTRYQLERFQAEATTLKEHRMSIQVVSTDIEKFKNKLPGINIVDPGSAGLESFSRPSASPVGISLFGYVSKGVLPYAMLENEKGEVIAVHVPKDLRNLPGPDYFLRYAQTNR